MKDPGLCSMNDSVTSNLWEGGIKRSVLAVFSALIVLLATGCDSSGGDSTTSTGNKPPTGTQPKPSYAQCSGGGIGEDTSRTSIGLHFGGVIGESAGGVVMDEVGGQVVVAEGGNLRWYDTQGNPGRVLKHGSRASYALDRGGNGVLAVIDDAGLAVFNAQGDTLWTRSRILGDTAGEGARVAVGADGSVAALFPGGKVEVFSPTGGIAFHQDGGK